MLAPMCGMIDDTFTPAHHSCFLWLPVRLCIDFKILLLFFKVLYCLKKDYLSDLLQPCDRASRVFGHFETFGLFQSAEHKLLMGQCPGLLV